MNITLIGGSGFVGSRLASLLDGSHSVRNIDKVESPNFPGESVVADICERGELAEAFSGETDAVVLLAAEHRDDVSPVSRYFDVNVDGTRNVLEEMDRRGIRSLVFTSSVAVYGMNKAKPPVETDPPDPFNQYGASKWEAEEVIREWVEKGEGRSALVIRPTVIFGEGNRGNVYNLLSQIQGGRFIMIGSGGNSKSMAYVGNVVAFIEYKLTEGFSGLEVFNYVDKPDLDMNTLVSVVYEFNGREGSRIRLPYALGLAGGYLCDALAFVTRRRLPISSIRVKKFCATTQFAADRIEESGFTRPFTLKQGLERTLESEFGKPSGSGPQGSDS